MCGGGGEGLPELLCLETKSVVKEKSRACKARGTASGKKPLACVSGGLNKKKGTR